MGGQKAADLVEDEINYFSENNFWSKVHWCRDNALFIYYNCHVPQICAFILPSLNFFTFCQNYIFPAKNYLTVIFRRPIFGQKCIDVVTIHFLSILIVTSQKFVPSHNFCQNYIFRAKNYLTVIFRRPIFGQKCIDVVTIHFLSILIVTSQKFVYLYCLHTIFVKIIFFGQKITKMVFFGDPFLVKRVLMLWQCTLSTKF